jgi:hypothetical protein
VVVGWTDDAFPGVVFGRAEDAFCKGVVGCTDDVFPDGCGCGCGCPGVVLGCTENALDDVSCKVVLCGAEDAFPDGCPWDALPDGAEDTLAGLLFWIGGRLVRLLIELFITLDKSIGLGT